MNGVEERVIQLGASPGSVGSDRPGSVSARALCGELLCGRLSTSGEISGMVGKKGAPREGGRWFCLFFGAGKPRSLNTILVSLTGTLENVVLPSLYFLPGISSGGIAGGGRIGLGNGG